MSGVLPAGIAAEQAIVKQNMAMSVLKQSAQADKAIANILEQSVQASATLGTNVNISA